MCGSRAAPCYSAAVEAAPSATEVVKAGGGEAYTFASACFRATGCFAGVFAAGFAVVFFADVLLLAAFLASTALAGPADVVSDLAAGFFARALVFFVPGLCLEDLVAAVFAVVGRLVVTAAFPFWLPPRARCAAAIRFLPAAVKVRRFGANSSGLKLVALFFEPLGRPRRVGSLDPMEREAVRLVAPAEEPSAPAPSRSRTCVRRVISVSIAAMSSVAFMVLISIRQTPSTETRSCSLVRKCSGLSTTFLLGSRLRARNSEADLRVPR